MTNVVTAITDVFEALSGWIVSAIGDVSALFYNAESGLTFMGTLAVIGLGIGIVFLLIGVIQNFLRMRS